MTRAHRVIEVSFVLTLATLAAYYIYRYPLRINSTSTSPTYSDTPVELQVGKYVFLAGITLVGFLALLRRRPALPGWRARVTAADMLLAAIGAFALLRAGVAAAESGSVTSLDFVGPIVSVIPIVLLIGTTLGRATQRRLGQHAFRIAASVLVLHAAANAAQLVAWKTTGRLPALAHEGALVRFGGLWDDPNSCAAYSASVLVFLASRRIGLSPNAERALAVAALYNLVLASSYSGWMLLGLGLATLYAMKLQWRKLAIVASLIAAVAIVVLIPGIDDALGELPGVGEVFELKRGSFDLRRDWETYFWVPDTPLAWVIGSNAPGGAENGFANWFSATGAVGLAALLVWIWLATRVIARSPESHWLLSIAIGLFGASIFVPYLTTFPVACIFVVALSMTASYYRERVTETRTTAPRAALEGA